MNETDTIHTSGKSAAAAIPRSAPFTANRAGSRFTGVSFAPSRFGAIRARGGPSVSCDQGAGRGEPKLQRRHGENEQEQHEGHRGGITQVPPFESLFVHEVEHAYRALQ